MANTPPYTPPSGSGTVADAIKEFEKAKGEKKFAEVIKKISKPYDPRDPSTFRGGSGEAPPPAPASSYDYQAELRREAERQRIADELKAEELRIQKQKLSEQQKSKEIAFARLQASKKREQYKSKLTPVQYLGFTKRAGKEYEEAKKEYEAYQEKVKSGQIVGFSGTGLTPQQEAKKVFLEKLGVIPKTETPKEYFIDITKKPRPLTFMDIIEKPYLIAPFPTKSTEVEKPLGKKPFEIKLLKVPDWYSKQVETYIKPIAPSEKTLKATVKVPLYFVDVGADISNVLGRTKFGKQLGFEDYEKLPSDYTKNIFGFDLKKSADYDFSTPYLADTDIQTLYSQVAVTFGASKGLVLGTSLLLSKPITELTVKGLDIIIPPTKTSFAPSGIPRQVARGGLFYATTPLTGGAFAKELGMQFAISPIEAGTEFGKYALENPYEIATIFGAGKIRKTVKLRELKLPQEVGEISIKVFGIETPKGRAVSIISKTPEGFKFGTPDISGYLKDIPKTSDIKIGSALETRLIQKGLEKAETTPRAKELIPTAQTLLRETLKTKSAFIDKELIYSATERLPKEGVKVLLDIAKEEKGVLFGSKARAFQLAKEYKIEGAKYELIKVPRDIELRFDKFTESDLGMVTEKTISRLKKLGTIKEGDKIFKLETAREIMEGGERTFSIEAKVGKDFVKVAEFKGKKSIIEGEAVPEFVVGIKKVGKIMKIDKIEATRLSEELRGVTQGVVRLTKKEGILDIYPPEKRLKDIGSVSVSARTLEMSRKIPSIKLKGAIEKFESLFPKELVREQIKKVLSETEKELLADFSKSELVKGYTGKGISKSLGYEKIIDSDINIEKSISPKSKSVSSKDSPYYYDLYPSKSVSPSISLSINKSLYSDISPYPSPSVSPYPSPSPYPSISILPYPSVSPYPSPSPSPSPSPYEEPPETKSPLYFDDDLKTDLGIEKKQGFNVYIKEPKKKKFSKISKHPLNKIDSANLLSYTIDESTSRSGYLKPTKNKPKPIGLEIPNEYYSLTQDKFRPYKVRAGKKIYWKGIIEKSPYLIDTIGEKKELNAFRVLAKIKKQSIKNKEMMSDIMNL